MNIRSTLLILCCFLFTAKSHCQMTSNNYEVEFEKGLEKENPEYYKGLQSILKEFEEHLISKGIIENSSYKSYTGLLNEIRANKDKALAIQYTIGDSLQKLTKALAYEGPSPESVVHAMEYYNETDSKSFVFSEKMSELIEKKVAFNRAIFADVLVTVYDEKDFELPMVKLKILRFLDPKSDVILHIDAGRPHPE